MNKIKFIKLLIIIFSLGIIFYNFFSTILSVSYQYFSSSYWDNFPMLKQTYLDSQYVNKNPKGWVPDEAVFSYSGGELILGTNPVLVIPDAPPLGKYLIGLSALIFNNEKIIVPIFAIGSLIMMYLIGLKLFNSKIISLIPVVLFSFEKIFKNQLIYVPLLDIFQLFFLLVSFYFFILGITNRRKKFILFAFSNLFLGFFISTKFFITGLTVFGAYFLTLLINKDRRGIVYLITTTPIAIIVLLSSYLRVLAFGYSIRELIGIQKWVYLYHNSFLIFPFSIWPLLLFNKWYVWFGDKPIITDSQWSITWPILIIIYTGGLFLYFFRKIKIRKQELIFFVWPAVYLFFHSFGQAFSRYFVILIPVLYIVAIKVIIEIIKTSKTKK